MSATRQRPIQRTFLSIVRLSQTGGLYALLLALVTLRINRGLMYSVSQLYKARFDVVLGRKGWCHSYTKEPNCLWADSAPLGRGMSFCTAYY